MIAISNLGAFRKRLINFISIIALAFLFGFHDAYSSENVSNDFRCGHFGEYEFNVNKRFLYFWIAYEGRDDWSVKKDPPPAGCETQIKSVTLEVYWPGMRPAGHLSIQADKNKEHMSVTIDSVKKRNSWDLVHFFSHRTGLDLGEAKSGRHAQAFGLFNLTDIHDRLGEKSSEYYWKIDNGAVSIFLECKSLTGNGLGVCESFQFYPYLQAIIKIRFHRENLKFWKQITTDVRVFIDSVIIYHGS